MNAIWRLLVVESLTQPRMAAKRLLGLELPTGVLWQAALAAAALASVFQYLFFQSLPPEFLEQLGDAQPNLIFAALMQFAQVAIMALAVHRVGRVFGGTGDFPSSLAIVVLISVISTLWTMAMFVSAAIFFPLLTMVVFGAMAWHLWAFGTLVAELHGFDSPLKVVLLALPMGMALALALLLVIGIILALLGVQPPEST